MTKSICLDHLTRPNLFIANRGPVSLILIVQWMRILGVITEVIYYLVEKARKLKVIFIDDDRDRVPPSEPDDIASLWEAVQRTPTRNNLIKLYLCNFGRYHSPYFSYTRLLGWYVSELWLLSLLSELSLKLDLGKIDWSPFVPRDEIMMVTPFMTTVFLNYVLSLTATPLSH